MTTAWRPPHVGRSNRLPRSVFRNHSRQKCRLILATGSERIRIAAADRDQLQVVVEVDAFLVPVLSVRGAQLQIIEYSEVAARKGLFGDAPGERHAREQPPALVGAEAGAAIVAQRGVEQVLVVEPVTQAGEERSDRALRAAAAGPGVAGPAEIESPHVLVNSASPT